jgi:molecular chaperone GrpE
MTDETATPEPERGPEAPAAAPDAATAQDEVGRLRAALEEKTDRYLRALAELDNQRKRAQREREEYVRYANESLLRELIPILDNFDRALGAARLGAEPQGVVAGVELIQREILKALEKFGVTAYSGLGQRFDPERHEAVQRVVKPDAAEMTVVDEVQRGYLLNGRVLRPAMVVVAVPPEEAPPPETP